MKRSYENKYIEYKRLIRNLRLKSLQEGEYYERRVDDKKNNNSK